MHKFLNKMSDDKEHLDYVKDKRIACKFGVKCFQKNPLHHKKYKHPPKPTAQVHIVYNKLYVKILFLILIRRELLPVTPHHQRDLKWKMKKNSKLL